MSNKYYKIIKDSISFITNCVENAGAKGVVFGLSGGIDSAVVAHLCASAYPKNCLAMIMPNYDFTPNSETNDGILIAQKLGIRYEIFPIGEISNAYNSNDTKLIRGNLNARIRANILYMRAAQNNYLVCGTSDKSEFMIGYFTKYGDSACDIAPIVHLYKTEVKELASFLGVPDHIIKKQSSAHLYKDHSAAHELGMAYESIDKLLQLGKLQDMRKRVEHKQNLPLRQE